MRVNPRGLKPFTEEEKRQILPFHNKGMNALQVFVELHKRQPTEKELNRIKKLSIRQGVVLDGRA